MGKDKEVFVQLNITNGPDRMELANVFFDRAARSQNVYFYSEEIPKPLEVYLEGSAIVPNEPTKIVLSGRISIGNEMRPFSFIYDFEGRHGFLEA